MIPLLPVTVHVQQPCEDEEDEGSEDHDEDPRRLLSMEICRNNVSEWCCITYNLVQSRHLFLSMGINTV